MKITKRQLRGIIQEATEEVTMYDQGREDSFAGIRPQFPDEDYMMGYNEAQADAGLPRMQAPSDSGRGKKLDPRKLKGAFAGKQRGSRPGEIALDFGKDIGTYNYIDEGRMKITKRQLRRIIKEEKQKLVEMREMRFDLMYKPIYSTLEDMVMMNLPDDVEYLTEEEFAKLERVVAEALSELKDRVVDTRRFNR